MRTTAEVPRSHRLEKPRRGWFSRSKERSTRRQFPVADVTALLQSPHKLPQGMTVSLTDRSRDGMTLVVQHASYGSKPLAVITMELRHGAYETWEEVWSLQLTRPRVYEVREIRGGLRGCFDIVKNHYGLWWY